MKYRLTNTTERVVTAAVDVLRESPADAAPLCSCAACRADIMALTLCSLPPHYCTGREDESFVREKLGSRVEREVVHSAQRVAKHPKHDRVEEGKGDVNLLNFTFEEGSALLASLPGQEPFPCSCDTCSSDILAYTLNRFPPKYGVARSGKIEFPQHERDSLRQDMAFILALAVGVVSSKPRHS